jgi:NAD(P)-dependent dehydrogenase (short-subunit alcohol dehydrogenase family)
VQTDITNEESVKSAIDEVATRGGRFDGLIANAGATKHLPALDFTLEQFERLYKLNVTGSWLCATYAARKFIELKTKGSIVFTASMTSYRPNRAAPSAPYGGTKAAVRNMTHTLAMEWAQYGIRVNSISPGYVKTALTYYVESSPDWVSRASTTFHRNIISYRRANMSCAQSGPQDEVLRRYAPSGSPARAGWCLRLPTVRDGHIHDRYRYPHCRYRRWMVKKQKKTRKRQQKKAFAK